MRPQNVANGLQGTEGRSRGGSLLLLGILLCGCACGAAAVPPAGDLKSLSELVSDLSSDLPVSASVLEQLLNVPAGTHRDELGWQEYPVDYRTRDGTSLYINFTAADPYADTFEIARITLTINWHECVDPAVFRAALEREGAVWIPGPKQGSFSTMMHGHYVSIGQRPGSKCLAGVMVDERRGAIRVGPSRQVIPQAGRYR